MFCGKGRSNSGFRGLGSNGCCGETEIPDSSIKEPSLDGKETWLLE